MAAAGDARSGGNESGQGGRKPWLCLHPCFNVICAEVRGTTNTSIAASSIRAPRHDDAPAIGLLLHQPQQDSRWCVQVVHADSIPQVLNQRMIIDVLRDDTDATVRRVDVQGVFELIQRLGADNEPVPGVLIVDENEKLHDRSDCTRRAEQTHLTLVAPRSP